MVKQLSKKTVYPITVVNLKSIPFRFTNILNECKCVNTLCIYYDKRHCKKLDIPYSVLLEYGTRDFLPQNQRRGVYLWWDT